MVEVVDETPERPHIGSKTLSKREFLKTTKFPKIELMKIIKERAIKRKDWHVPSHEDYLKDSMSAERIPPVIDLESNS